ncbi:response regulator [Salinimicrobium sediminilitoris]|uniref:response regulator n=1 Tax=Salinimicrobium sediminilitoris TaxID=2876715 RepID=UPI001E347955|nr:response regulator [Salinimicrobium sediminilitoris]MCC8361066.1 response regulator [Salinimicrobium sediminilitoris]
MNLDLVVIDDDAVVLFLHKVLIKKSKLPSNVLDFLHAREALEFLSNHPPTKPLLILLDINMPQCTGWEFLEQVARLPKADKIYVVMVTSSINESDRKRAAGFPQVIGFREKPLSKQDCEDIYIKLLPLLNS